MFARYPAPKPLSMFTTDTPLAQELSILSSAATPPKAALNSYCNMTVASATQDGSTLTLTGGSVDVQAPRITNEGETITCSKAELVLTFNEEIVGTAALTMEAAEIPGSYTADISGITFNIPTMEDDQQLSIRLDVTLSNGQFLTAPGGTFSFLNGEMVSSVG